MLVFGTTLVQCHAALSFTKTHGVTYGRVLNESVFPSLPPCRLSDVDDLHIALEELTHSVKCLIELYCRTFHTDFRFDSATNVFRGERIHNRIMTLVKLTLYFQKNSRRFVILQNCNIHKSKNGNKL